MNEEKLISDIDSLKKGDYIEVSFKAMKDKTTILTEKYVVSKITNNFLFLTNNRRDVKLKLTQIVNIKWLLKISDFCNNCKYGFYNQYYCKECVKVTNDEMQVPVYFVPYNKVEEK